jgi:hypothetical protein
MAAACAPPAQPPSVFPHLVEAPLLHGVGDGTDKGLDAR